jgi:hypothetical protein
MSPAMMRSSVLLPEPDCPSSATISPFAQGEVDGVEHRAHVAVGGAEGLADFLQFDDGGCPLIDPSGMHAVFGQAIQPAPDEVVEAHHEHAHHADAQRDAREVADAVMCAM